MFQLADSTRTALSLVNTEHYNDNNDCNNNNNKNLSSNNFGAKIQFQKAMEWCHLIMLIFHQNLPQEELMCKNTSTTRATCATCATCATYATCAQNRARESAYNNNILVYLKTKNKWQYCLVSVMLFTTYEDKFWWLPP